MEIFLLFALIIPKLSAVDCLYVGKVYQDLFLLYFQNLFEPFNILHLEELILGANLPASELQRLKWKTTDASPVHGDDTLYYSKIFNCCHFSFPPAKMHSEASASDEFWKHCFSYITATVHLFMIPG